MTKINSDKIMTKLLNGREKPSLGTQCNMIKIGTALVMADAAVGVKW